MRILLDKVDQIAAGVWRTSTPSHQIPMFGQPRTSHGQQSVLLADAPKYDGATNSIQLQVDSVIVLNLGSTSTTVIVEAGFQKPDVAIDADDADGFRVGPGDREFLSLIRRELRGDPLTAAEQILAQIRSKNPGDLQRGMRQNFKNTPDNFWYVIVQPRVQALSITVRGPKEHFVSYGRRLKLKDDRPGYTRFSLQRSSDVDEALSIIEASRRRR